MSALSNPLAVYYDLMSSLNLFIAHNIQIVEVLGVGPLQGTFCWEQG